MKKHDEQRILCKRDSEATQQRNSECTDVERSRIRER
jgi:hypothetical protein